LKDVLEGRMEGKRPRGRPRMGMIDDLKEGSYACMKRRAEDRELESLDAKDLPWDRELMMIMMMMIIMMMMMIIDDLQWLLWWRTEHQGYVKNAIAFQDPDTNLF
jgi:hypothetical protein